MRRRGQASAEFAVVSMLVILIVLGVMDFGLLFIARIAAYQSDRAAARFAATNPTAWTSAANPPANTIEGVLLVRALPISISNKDTDITISYLVAGSGPAASCGSWSAASNQFVAQPGYTQATCVVKGRLVQVQAAYRYTFVTPILRAIFGTATFTTRSAAYEEI